MKHDSKFSYVVRPPVFGAITLALLMTGASGLLIDFTPHQIGKLALSRFPEAFQTVSGKWNPATVGFLVYGTVVLVIFSLWNFRHVTFDASSRRFHVWICLGPIPILRRTYWFEQIRFIDMEYVPNGFLSHLFSGEYDHTMYGHEEGVGTFRLKIVMENRTAILAGRAWSPDPLRKTAERIGAMTGARIG